ncbi:angiogenic factor with G patch and FHA domains 1-like [Glandiceps talaboti]
MELPEALSELEDLKKRVVSLEGELKQAVAEKTKLEKKLSKEERSREIAESYNESLRKDVNTLRKQLHEFKSRKFTDTSTQTEVIQESSEDQTGKNMSNVEKQNDLTNLQDEGLSIADTLKATAEAALTQSGFVYDETSGLYYDYSTGYYYDSKNQLYYDQNTGIYYYYNQRTRTYEFHSQVEIPKQTIPEVKDALGDTNARERRKKRRKAAGKQNTKSSTVKYDSSEDEEVIEITDNEPKHKKRESYQKKVKQKDIEVIEIDVSDDSCHGNNEEDCHDNKADSPVGLKSDSEMEEGEISDSSKEESLEVMETESFTEDEEEEDEIVKEHWPACVRLIATESESLKLGTLFIITYMGGTIGREDSHSVCIPDIGVSKKHAEIGYNQDKQQYWIKDCGSQNGTVVNDNPLTVEAREESECSPLSHGDTVRIGTTVLRVHIHPGDETCNDCEPGIVQAALAKQETQTVTILTKEEREKLRKKQLKQIKKKYMLANADYEDNTDAINNPNYSDRAQHRRKTVGSDNPHQKDDLPASVDRAIDKSNVGHKMLKKMGWKDGQLLGKHEQGLDKPIQVVVRDKKAGLGAGVCRSMDEVQYSKRNNQNWDKARNRFQQMQNPKDQPRNTGKAQLQWVKGDTESLDVPKTSSEIADSEQTDTKTATKITKDEQIFDI